MIGKLCIMQLRQKHHNSTVCNPDSQHRIRYDSTYRNLVQITEMNYFYAVPISHATRIKTLKFKFFKI
jgi:hypothetical protein